MPNHTNLEKILSTPSPTIELQSELLEAKSIQVFVKREDLIHPDVSGNKWRKLKYNLIKAESEGKEKILTFGGAFSNHIYATSAACKIAGFQSTGIIRGNYVDTNNSTLAFAQAQGMSIKTVSRSIYGSIKNEKIQEDYPDFFIVPEGGNNIEGREGLKDLAIELKNEYKKEKIQLILPIGTGCTMAGLLNHLPQNFELIGINALKNKGIEKDLKNWVTNEKILYSINHGYHFGGFAKLNQKLVDFSNTFLSKHKFLLDPIYTAKMMYGVFDMIQKDEFPKGTKIVCIHTGGLQGILPINARGKFRINT